jgi:TetR/AcrR family transcriptional regulator, regulator of mycofactocin system
VPAGPAARRGRPPGTSRRTLELIALRLFTEQSFDETPIEQIAAAAGVSRRTFFRYFDSKASVLWGEFDSEITVIREALAQAPDSVPMMDAIRQAVVAANHYRAEDVPELRARMNLIASAPSLQSSAAVRYDAWERVVSQFVAGRTGHPPWSLYPLTVGRSTLAACRAAYERWSARADGDLTVYLDAALSALSAGFDTTAMGFPEQRLDGTPSITERDLFHRTIRGRRLPCQERPAGGAARALLPTGSGRLFSRLTREHPRPGNRSPGPVRDQNACAALRCRAGRRAGAR